MIISIFNKPGTPSHIEPLPTIIQKIRKGTWYIQVTMIQNYIASGNEVAARRALMNLTRFTPAGHFNGERSRDTIVSYTGLVLLESAFLPDDVLGEYRKAIEADAHTCACFLGPEGDNLRILVKVDSPIDAHAKAYEQVKMYYQKRLHLTIMADKRGLLALCPLSSDPKVFYNPDSTAFSIKLDKPK